VWVWVGVGVGVGGGWVGVGGRGWVGGVVSTHEHAPLMLSCLAVRPAGWLAAGVESVLIDVFITFELPVPAGEQVADDLLGRASAGYPNDPLLSKQPWLDMVNAQEAWDNYRRGSREVGVASRAAWSCYACFAPDIGSKGSVCVCVWGGGGATGSPSCSVGLRAWSASLALRLSARRTSTAAPI
jgi:hypothetical protein